MQGRDDRPLAYIGVQDIALLDPDLAVPAANAVDLVVEVAHSCAPEQHTFAVTLAPDSRVKSTTAQVGLRYSHYP